MHRPVFLLVCLLLIGLPCAGRAQTPMRDKIRAGAQAEADNLKKKEYAKIIDSMYPPILELAGGREAMLKVLKDGMVQMDADGFKVDKVEIGQASEPVAGGDKMFSIVPQIAHMTGPKMLVEQEGYLLAVSTDNGSTWYYLDGAVLTDELVKQFFADFPVTLKLPVRKQPKVTPNS